LEKRSAVWSSTTYGNFGAPDWPLGGTSSAQGRIRYWLFPHRHYGRGRVHQGPVVKVAGEGQSVGVRKTTDGIHSDRRLLRTAAQRHGRWINVAPVLYW